MLSESYDIIVTAGPVQNIRVRSNHGAVIWADTGMTIHHGLQNGIRNDSGP